MYEHRCMKSTKKLYKSSVKCDSKQQYKDIFESGMVSTTGVFTYNVSISPVPSVAVKVLVQ